MSLGNWKLGSLGLRTSNSTWISRKARDCRSWRNIVPNVTFRRSKSIMERTNIAWRRRLEWMVLGSLVWSLWNVIPKRIGKRSNSTHKLGNWTRSLRTFLSSTTGIYARYRRITRSTKIGHRQDVASGITVRLVVERLGEQWPNIQKLTWSWVTSGGTDTRARNLWFWTIWTLKLPNVWVSTWSIGQILGVKCQGK